MRQLTLIITALLLISPFAANATPIPIGDQTDVAISTVAGGWGWTGSGAATHTAIRFEEHYHENWSWEFSELGNAVNLNSCDLGLVANNIGMCWHTGGGSLQSGWALNDRRSFRGPGNSVLLAANATAVPEPGTLALFGLGLIAMGISRRKKKV